MPVDARERIENRLIDFCRSMGRPVEMVADETNMLKGLGMSSPDGIDFALDLCEEFSIDLPKDFNPFVDDSGRKSRTFRQLVDSIRPHLEGTS